MQQTLETHKKQLDGIRRYLESETSFIEVISIRSGKLRRDYKFYLKQYETAIATGLETFDRSKFMQGG